MELNHLALLNRFSPEKGSFFSIYFAHNKIMDATKATGNNG